MYGTHSVRKGVATYACSGSTGGPSIVSVCIRCGWSLGDVQDRYLRYADAGDQFLGRVVAGLPLAKSAFAVLPPHFDKTADPVVQHCLERTFPAVYADPQLRPILALCMALLLYHYDFLVRAFPTAHALIPTFIFRNSDLVVNLRRLVSTSESPQMRPTGVPPYITLFQQHELTREAVEHVPGAVVAKVAALLEENAAGAGAITRATLAPTMHELLVETGWRRDTRADAHGGNGPAPARALHTWGNKLHVLPEDFDFPSIDLLGAWQLWWFGNSVRGYPPFQSISTHDLSTRGKKKTYSDWKSIMAWLIEAIERETGNPIPSQISEEVAVSLFEIGAQKLPMIDASHERRWSQLKVTTCLRLVREAVLAENPDRVRAPFKQRKRHKVADV